MKRGCLVLLIRMSVTKFLLVAVCLAAALLVTPGCYDKHPEYERFYECGSQSDCLSGYECVYAGQKNVCSSKTGCGSDGCPQGQACMNGECYVCDHSNCKWVWASEDVISSDVQDDLVTDTNVGVDTLCTPDCGDLVCGDDPICGKSCGTCETGWWCDTGVCKDGCAGMECGESFSGEICGTCEGGLCQFNGKCQEVETVLIPAGSFWMGCNTAVDSECEVDESPYHEVTLSAYYMDRTEVTVGAYRECVRDGSCMIPSSESYYCNSINDSFKQEHPMNCVDWFQSKTYCTWAGKRLPTEAEWEKAARGTDGRRYPWGNQALTCNYATMAGCGTNGTSPPCSKSPLGDSSYGLCDMSGNVLEWVSDWYGSDYYGSSPGTDPVGPAIGSTRVGRGGSFVNSDVGDFRVSFRYYGDRSDIPDALGFRCARSQ